MSSESLPASGAKGTGNGGWQIPRGRHRLPREVVIDHQRQRLLGCAARALAEHGYAGMSVEHVLEQAGVSRTTFYENFANKQECVLVAHEAVFDRLTGAIFRACASARQWPDRVASAVHAALDFAIRSPAETRLLLLDAVAADPVMARRVIASNDHLVGLLRGGREHCPQAALLPELTERALLGATTSVIGSRLMADQADRLPELEPQLVQLILMPYVGVEEAARVARSNVSSIG